MPIQRSEGPVGLIVCPSRELARQTFDIVVEYSEALKQGGWVGAGPACWIGLCSRRGGTAAGCAWRWCDAGGWLHHLRAAVPALLLQAPGPTLHARPQPAPSSAQPRPAHPHSPAPQPRRRLPGAALAAGHRRRGHEDAGRPDPQHGHTHGGGHAGAPQGHADVRQGGGAEGSRVGGRPVRRAWVVLSCARGEVEVRHHITDTPLTSLAPQPWQATNTCMPLPPPCLSPTHMHTQQAAHDPGYLPLPVPG